jgi:cytochrome c oxidase cbb3-type subunit 3
MRNVRVLTVATAVVAVGLTVSARQGPPPAGQQPQEIRVTIPARPDGAVVQIPRTPVVDQAAHDRGRAIWARECVDCHGTQARGSDTGPNIIRTKTVNFDRSSPTPGSVLGPFLKAGHKTQSGKPSPSFTDDEIVALAHFLRQCVNDTMRGSAVFTVGDILVGDRAAGEAYFNGAGKCATCHNATTRNLAGIGTRIPAPVDIQQRMLFPGSGAGGRGRGAAAAPTGANAITVAITAPTGPTLTGVLVEQSDFFVTLRLADGTTRAVRKVPGTKVVLTNPLQAHIDLLDAITDTQIHDLVAYLESLK